MTEEDGKIFFSSIVEAYKDTDEYRVLLIKSDGNHYEVIVPLDNDFAKKDMIYTIAAKIKYSFFCKEIEEHYILDYYA